MNTPRYLVGLIIACTLAAVPVHAAVIYDNQAVRDYAYVSDTNSSFRMFFADDFILQTGASTVTGFRWSGIYASGNTPSTPDDFTILIFSDQGDAPTSNPLYSLHVGNNVNRAATGDQMFGYDRYSYFGEIAPLTLDAGTRYWLSIYNSLRMETDDSWYWPVQTTSGRAYYRQSVTGPWLSDEQLEFDFQIEGTLDNTPAAVPEPTSMLLVGSGVAGLFFRGRRRKCANMTHSQCLAVVAEAPRPFDSSSQPS